MLDVPGKDSANRVLTRDRRLIFHILRLDFKAGDMVGAIHKGMDERMKVMNAVFVSPGEAPRVVSARFQIPLDIIANGDVLMLNLIGKFDHALNRSLVDSIPEPPIKLEQNFVVAEWHDNVC